jgi:hypothetical protein
MGTIMIRCPQTGRAIPTGMKANREAFRCSPVFFGWTRCAVCQTDHEWFSRDAWIYDRSEKHGAAAKSIIR